MSGGRLFLSYSSKDGAEVTLFDRDLRRRGVPLWRDETDLAYAQVAEEEVARAAAEASGFVFYLTRRAARSKWVRETELRYAHENRELDSSSGILPIFREDMNQVSRLMIERGLRKTRSAASSEYDLRRFSGYRFRVDRLGVHGVQGELRAAADSVLRALLTTLARRSGGDRPLRIAAMTRGGPAARASDFDLLVDWTADYPADDERPSPTPGQAAEHLTPALACLVGAVRDVWPGRLLQILPQCHLSMALALGYLFRRNSGFSLDVVEVHSGDHWPGPSPPLEGDINLWRITAENPSELPGATDLAVAVGVSQPIVEKARAHIREASVPVGRLLTFEPVSGTSLRSLAGVPPLHPHRMAVAVADAVHQERPSAGATLHVFYAGPPALAVLLAQQLSTVGQIQTYEWRKTLDAYTPSIRLV